MPFWFNCFLNARQLIHQAAQHRGPAQGPTPRQEGPLGARVTGASGRGHGGRRPRHPPRKAFPAELLGPPLLGMS